MGGIDGCILLLNVLLVLPILGLVYKFGTSPAAPATCLLLFSVLSCCDTVVTPSRLGNLEKQARSLAVHQKKLEEEVQQIENKYSNKKRKFLDDAEQFRRELKRVRATTVQIDTISSLHVSIIDV